MACNKGDVMVAKEVRADEVQASALDRAKAAVNDPKLSFDAVSRVVFSLVSENGLKLDDRTKIMDLYCEKFKGKALDALTQNIKAIGMTSESLAEVKKDSQRRYDHMMTLAYGVARFGDDGFDKAIEIVRAAGAAKGFLPVSKNVFKLAHGIADTAVMMMLKNGWLDVKADSEKVSKLILDTTLGNNEKAQVIYWLFKLNPDALYDLREKVDNSSIEAKLIDGFLKGKRVRKKMDDDAPYERTNMNERGSQDYKTALSFVPRITKT
jgi:hypothetical protein